MREFSVPASFAVGEHDNVASMVYSHERDDPDHVIFQRLVNGVWTDVTCAQAAQQIRHVALGLIAEGVNAGDRVAILSGTRYEWVILDYAILSVGALTVPIYDTSSAEQVRWVLEDSGTVLVIAETDAHAQLVKELSDELPSLRKILHLESSGPTALDELAEAGKSVDIGQLDERLAGLRAADPATLIYTSGTTGRPKGCQLTHSNLLYETRGAASCFPTLLRKGERLLVFLPLAHVLARALSMSAFANKVTIGYTSDMKNLAPTLAVFKPTVVVSVPRVFEKVYNTAELKARDSRRGMVFHIAARTATEWSTAQDTGGPGLLLQARHALFDRLVYGKLRAALGGDCHAAVSGGAPLGKRLCHFYRGVGLTVYEGYGLTETSSAITVNRISDERVGTVESCYPATAWRSPTTARCCCAVAWCSTAIGITRKPLARRSSTGGSTPATSDRWTTTGSCRSSAARGDHRDRGRQERRSGRARRSVAGPPPDQPGGGGRGQQAVCGCADSDRPRRRRRVEGAPRQGGHRLRRGPGQRSRPGRRDRSGRQQCQPDGVAGGIDSQVPDSADRLHRADRRVDTDAEGEAKRGRRTVRQRDRVALQQALTAL